MGLTPNFALAAVQTANQIGLEISDLISSTGCGNTCRTASDVANTEMLLNNIVSQNYWGMPAPRPKSAQTKALAYIDAIVRWMVQQCSNPALGDAGYRCVAERTGNGCPPNCPLTCGDGTQCCCNIIITVRNPIANDTNVYDDSANPVGLSQAYGPNLVPTNTLSVDGGGGIVASRDNGGSSYAGGGSTSGGYNTYQSGAAGSAAGAGAPAVRLPVILAAAGGVLLLILLLKR